MEENGKAKIRDEVLDKLKYSENLMAGFNDFYDDCWMDWRVKSKKTSGPGRGFSNMKSGETHRAVEALSSTWTRMLTAQDPCFQAVATGAIPFEDEVVEGILYATEGLINRQLKETLFKPELLRGVRGVALLGTGIWEEPWVKIQTSGSSSFEGTGFKVRPLYSSFFDANAYDLYFSDFMGTIDYVSKWRLKNIIQSDPNVWDASQLGEIMNEDFGKNANFEARAYTRMLERKTRAGYMNVGNNVKELLTYHGRLDTENPFIMQYWESLGRTDDPSLVDFTVCFVDGNAQVKFHVAPYGTWKSMFKYAHYKQMEDEMLGYGVGQIGRRTQKDLDNFFNRVSDMVMFGSYPMWLVNRMAGLKPSQLNIKPWNIIDVDGDPSSALSLLKLDPNNIQMNINFQSILRDEIRNNTGASANLQAINTGGTATEASLTQTEAMRQAGVQAEIIGETLVRKHLEQMHANNVNLIDEDVWVNMTGIDKPVQLNKHDLPQNIGFEIKITTDKDYRPDRQKQILEGLNTATSIRNVIPEGLNLVRPLYAEYLRGLGINPRLLERPMPIKDQLSINLQRAQRTGQMGNPANEVEGEISDEMSGNSASISTPMGTVPTSPVQGVSA